MAESEQQNQNTAEKEKKDKLAKQIDKIADKYFNQQGYAEITVHLGVDENPPIVEIMKRQNNKKYLF